MKKEEGNILDTIEAYSCLRLNTTLEYRTFLDGGWIM